MKPELVILAHNIRSAYNVGSIFRTADAAGVARVVLSGYSARPPHPGVVKTALGAEQSVSWEGIQTPGPWLRQMRKRGYHIAALELTSQSHNLFQWRPKWPLILIIGNEVRGISPALQNLSHDVVHIPMVGQKESLNVATAFGVTVYYCLFFSSKTGIVER